MYLRKLGFVKQGGPWWSNALKTVGTYAKNLETAYAPTQAFKPVEKVTSEIMHRPMLGLMPKAPIGVAPIAPKPPLGMGIIGRQARIVGQLTNPAEGSNILSRTGKVLKNEWNNAQFYTKEIGGKTYKYERSGIGKVLNPMTTTGLGIGALSTAIPDTNSSTPGSRIRSGIKNTLGWGLAGPVYGPYVLGSLGFDLAKGTLNK